MILPGSSAGPPDVPRSIVTQFFQNSNRFAGFFRLAAGMEKTYHVSVFGPVAGAAARLAAVTDLEGEPIRPARVEVLRETPGTAVLAVTIHEGKNRQVRRMCAQCGLTVKRLRRVREGALELGDLPPGKWRYLTQDEAGALGVTP